MFLQIKEFPRYFITSEGDVISTVGGTWKVLKGGVEGWGYHLVSLFRDGKPYSKKVHTLVAECFLGPRPDGYDINHKNGIKTDNRLENLEYCTRAQNTQHAYNLGLAKGVRGEHHGNSKLSDTQALDLMTLKGTMSQSKAASIFNISREHVRDMWNGKRRSYLSGKASV